MRLWLLVSFLPVLLAVLVHEPVGAPPGPTPFYTQTFGTGNSDCATDGLYQERQGDGLVSCACDSAAGCNYSVNPAAGFGDIGEMGDGTGAGGGAYIIEDTTARATGFADKKHIWFCGCFRYETPGTSEGYESFFYPRNGSSGVGQLNLQKRGHASVSANRGFAMRCPDDTRPSPPVLPGYGVWGYYCVEWNLNDCNGDSTGTCANLWLDSPTSDPPDATCPDTTIDLSASVINGWRAVIFDDSSQRGSVTWMDNFNVYDTAPDSLPAQTCP